MNSFQFPSKYSRKVLILISAFCLFTVHIFAQTYKLETVFKDQATGTYLSNWKLLDTTNDNDSETFSLWGYQRYFDNWADGIYEVEYFKGDAKEVYIFLNQIVEFSEKYQGEDRVLTYFSGIKVRTFNQLGFKYTLVFDKENKVACKFTLNQWEKLLNSFISYCENQKIKYY